MNMPDRLPERIETEEALDELLTRPRPELVKFIGSVRGPLVVLGAGGKMGPTLAVLAKRAAEEAGRPLEVIAASRFSDPGARAWLEARGVKAIQCDLLDREQIARLPGAENVVCLVGLKFGTAGQPFLTWAMNALVPANVVERYPRARMVALSTGNVYGLVPVNGGGSVETDPLTPLGEYPNAAVARERIFEYGAHRHGTPLALIRLNYAVELRYGVLVDIALKVLHGEPVDVTMGRFNCIWQGDANEFILRALASVQSPPAVLNLTGPRLWSVRETAARFGELLGKTVRFTGGEAATALVNNPAKACALWGEPPTPMEAMTRWIAHWLQRGGRLLGKPTRFEIRDGKY
jgi:uncharacterized protein YbjT (DUF2867 family)